MTREQDWTPEYLKAYEHGLKDAADSGVLQAVLDAIQGTLDPSTQIADHPNVKFAQMQRLKLLEEGRMAASDAPERDTPMDKLPKRDVPALIEALRIRAMALTGAEWERTATAAMMKEAADALEQLASPRASVATEEQARRKFMQFHNHYLGWGFDDSGEPHRKENAGVMFTSEGWSRPYERFTLFEKYADHGGDINATECAVIDKAMAAYAALSSPSPAPAAAQDEPQT